jgi:hypothetical protein
MESFYYRYFEHRRILRNALLFILAVATVATAVILVVVKTKGV